MNNPETPQQGIAQDIEQTFQFAVADHRAGRLENAEQGYLAVLQHEPNHAAANYNLGLLTLHSAHLERALNYFVVALNAEPTDSQYWLSYIEALLKAGQLETARQVMELARKNGLEGNAVNELDVHLTRAEAANQKNPHTLNNSLPVSDAVTHSVHSRASSDQTSARENKTMPSREEMDALVALFVAGQLDEALPIAKAMTEHYPEHEFGWKALGANFKQMGRQADALTAMRRAAAISPNDIENQNNLGITLQDMGQLKDAEACYLRALEINQNFAEAHNNLGACLQAMERLADAESSYRRALQIDPNYAKAYGNLGAALNDMGRYDEAENCNRKTLQLQPENAETHYNLSATLKDMGRPDEAETSCRRAIQIKPDYVDAHFNLGNILYDLGRMAEAEASYRQAFQLKPDFTSALDNLAMLYSVQGKFAEALNAVQQSLSIRETEEAKSVFVNCIKRLHFTQPHPDIYPLLIRALTEPWGRTSELARTSTALIKLEPEVNACIARANQSWPVRLATPTLFGAHGFTALENNELLNALLDSTPICDVEMERLLTTVRYNLLEAATSPSKYENNASLHFFSTLARQCFINEYVFSLTNDERLKANELRNQVTLLLEAGAPIPAIQLVTVAAYFPLYSLPQADRLLKHQWTDDIRAVLHQQVSEPLIEVALRANLTRLTDIQNEISLQVQSQYEESPYPRWVKTAPASKAKHLIAYLSHRFPRAPFNRTAKNGQIDVLIAGCGTGQQSIASAQRIHNTKLLAVDLSASSLAYAQRKTQELGLASIDYAQADLLKLGGAGHSFDVIESSGVLHHLENPWTGWTTLLSILRPGGFMKLGFYSEVARRDIVRIRNFIANQGYASTVDDIRRCRQDLMDLNARENFGEILTSPDFFSTSACRDLLFHVQEHRLTLKEIENFLHQNNLTFLGFEIEAESLNAYKQRFPDDPAATNLTHWNVFEHENPDTFGNMYQFWIQKPQG
jgi:tetratricopeptide (TPR) repeat protein/2-polyprenyl-3-methyl-5-hydroxy-6-metoxy-1,4-benzoquinol methylase